MHKWLEKIQPAVFIAFCILFMFHADIAKSETSVSYEIAAIEAKLDSNTLLYEIKGTTKPVYTVTERFSPFRIVVDIAGAFWAENLSSDTAQIPPNSFATLSLENLENQDPKIKRFVFKLTDSHDYEVTDTALGLQIAFAPATAGVENSQSGKLQGVTALQDFNVVSTPNSTTISIVSNGPIENYTVDTIGSGANKPPRMYIDIDNVAINELVREKKVGTSVAKIRVAPRGDGARIVFDSAEMELFKYSVAPSASGLDVVIDETGSKSTGNQGVEGGDTTLDKLITSSEELLSQDPEDIISKATSDKIASLEDDFSFSGYKKQRISVDFYKIDIHNVFRLFREITDLNIIIDEDVQGSLTLALNDVPWDFALDIILNLMDLKKEEKFNTIVIYPSKKEFLWPTRAEDNLAFEADIEVIEQEALIIEKTISQSKEVVMAKELIVKAQSLEQRQEYENAIMIYDKALELWPGNSKISNRMASLYLVNLGMNAKAVFYAKKTLAIDAQNRDASLYAAIGSANMQRISEANEYFTESISDNPPMKEALVSYAAFSENNGQNDAALTLIDKYHEYYGETIDTMIAKARILDKLGLGKDATQQYLSILASGFQLRPDLKKYIEGRLAAKDIK